VKKYIIAGRRVEMEPEGRTAVQSEKYRSDFEGFAEITVTVSDEIVENTLIKHSLPSRDEAYYLTSGFDFYRKLLDFGGIMFHASAVCIDKSAYFFAAKSGVGKSTHTALWCELLGDRCKILNDDKPALCIEEGKAVAYGTPWSGKHDKNENIGCELKGICFITRSKTNSIKRLDTKSAAMYIINQLTKNFTADRWDKVLDIIDTTVKTVPVYLLECNRDISAAKLSYTTMTGEEI
jgi:hypothetical protein